MFMTFSYHVKEMSEVDFHIESLYTLAISDAIKKHEKHLRFKRYDRIVFLLWLCSKNQSAKFHNYSCP